MESELWYLVLIPVLFAAGWWARGLDAGERERNSRRLPEAYSRGVAMLMSDRPDKAIDPFIEVVRLDPELIELHHVLGTLFRRRGEFERFFRAVRHRAAPHTFFERYVVRAASFRNEMRGRIYMRAVVHAHRQNGQVAAVCGNGPYLRQARRRIAGIYAATGHGSAYVYDLHQSLSSLSMLMNASEGISTLPNCRMRFFPSFCFSSSFFLRVTSPP